MQTIHGSRTQCSGGSTSFPMDQHLPGIKLKPSLDLEQTQVLKDAKCKNSYMAVEKGYASNGI